jgi:hypothetical protein
MVAKKRVSKKVTKKATKRATASPHTKYDPSKHPHQAYQMSLLGATDKEVAAVMMIQPSTFYSWKERYPKFRIASDEGKLLVDGLVAEKLLSRALGCSVPEDVILSHQGEHVETVRRLKHIEPNVVAQIFWLKNRRPKEWRDKQEIEATGDLGEALSKIASNLPD